VPALAKHLKDGLPNFDPASPDPFEQWNLPPSSFTGIVKPDGN
jgi:hypothetical protein